MSVCLHIVVKGRVQGVYFRVYTQKQAVKLNVNGFVRNLVNGDVEVIAAGAADAVHALVEWCHKGPILAKVTEVVVQPHDSGQVFSGFEIQ